MEMNPGENDNKKLEHDPEAKDPYGQEKQNEAAYELANNQMEADPESARNIFSDPPLIMQEAQAVQTGLPKDRV